VIVNASTIGNTTAPLIQVGANSSIIGWIFDGGYFLEKHGPYP
jgi:hypothetical protein